METEFKYTSRYLRFLSLVISLLLFSPFMVGNGISQDQGGNPASESKTTDGTYLLGPEDVLEISVWKNADLSREVTVRPDGMISLPLVGDIRAAGGSPEELRKKIVNKLKEYQETVVVSVIVLSVGSQKFFILGEVKTPGLYSLTKRTSLLQAIAMAGGFTEFASKNSIIVIREGGFSEFASKDSIIVVKEKGNIEKRIRVRFDDIVKGKGSGKDSNIILKAGDTIYVSGKAIF